MYLNINLYNIDAICLLSNYLDGDWGLGIGDW